MTAKRSPSDTKRRQLDTGADTGNAQVDAKRPDPQSLAREALAAYKSPGRPCNTCNLTGPAAECLAEFVALHNAGKHVPFALIRKTLHDAYGYALGEDSLRHHLLQHDTGWRA